MIVLFEYVLQALFYAGAGSCIFPFWTPEMEKRMEMTIGQRIKECRKNKGMTQEALAEKMLTDKSTISLYENDKIDIKSSVIAELAKVLGCTGGYLLEGSRMADANEELLMLFSKIKSEKVKAIAIKQLEALISLEVE